MSFNISDKKIIIIFFILTGTGYGALGLSTDSVNAEETQMMIDTKMFEHLATSNPHYATELKFQQIIEKIEVLTKIVCSGVSNKYCV